MKEFLKFVEKEFRHIFRDRRTILIVLVMPVVQIILFGFAISTDINHARVDIVGDLSDSQVRRIAERIDQNPCLEVVSAYTSTNGIGQRFRQGVSDVAVCFGQEFGKNLKKNGRAPLRIIGDGSDPNTAQMIANYVSGVVSDASADLNPAAKGDILLPDVNYMYNPGMKSSYNFVPGVMGLILMLICSMMTAISIVREKEYGTLELLLVSPIRPVWIILSKALPYLVLAAANLVTILILARLVIDVPVRGSLWLIAAISLLFILASLAIGLLISTIASTQRVALLLSGMGLMMPTMIFSGIIFPCESMPVALQFVSDLLPAKWYIILIKKVMIEGGGIDTILKETAILSVMTLLLFAASIKLFKERL